MAQQTAINWLREKLQETYDKEGKLPLAYTFSLLNKAETIEKEQRINSQMDMFHHINNMPYGLDYLTKRDAAEIFAEQYGGQGSPDTSPNTQNK